MNMVDQADLKWVGASCGCATVSKSGGAHSNYRVQEERIDFVATDNIPEQYDSDEAAASLHTSL